MRIKTTGLQRISWRMLPKVVREVDIPCMVHIHSSLLLRLDQGKWQRAKTENPNVYISPFRAYLLSTGGSDDTGSEIDDETGINNIHTTDLDGTERWYDLNGRIINGAPSKKGVYIRQGKKIVIR